MLKNEIGLDFWNGTLDELKLQYGAGDRAHAQKIPRLMFDLLKRAADEGKTSPTLNRILDAVMALKRQTAPIDPLRREDEVSSPVPVAEAA